MKKIKNVLPLVGFVTLMVIAIACGITITVCMISEYGVFGLIGEHKSAHVMKTLWDNYIAYRIALPLGAVCAIICGIITTILKK